MSGNSVSFFDDKLEDESIALSDSELNNIFNVNVAEEASAEDAPIQFDDADILRHEPDVIVVEKKDLSSLYSSPVAVPADEFAEMTEMPLEAEIASEPELVEEPELLVDTAEEISPMEEIPEEAPAMSSLDGEEILPLAEELSLEELTAEQPSGLEELEALPDISASEESSSLADNMELVETPSSTETPYKATEVPADEEILELVESEPESVEEILADGPMNFDDLTASENGMVEELPSLGAMESSPAEELVLDAEPAELSPFEDVTPVEFSDSSELGSADQIVLDESAEAPQELIIEENVPEIILDDAVSFSEPLSPGEPQEVNFDDIPSDAEVVESQTEPGEVTEELTIFSGDEPPKQRVPNSNSYFGDVDEDEAITLSSDELSNILDNAEVEEKSGMEVDPSSAFSSTPVVSSNDTATEEPHTADALFETLDSSLSRENLKEVFVYIDNLLDKLPEVEVQKFARSKYYDIYNRIFEELGII